MSTVEYGMQHPTQCWLISHHFSVSPEAKEVKPLATRDASGGVLNLTGPKKQVDSFDPNDLKACSDDTCFLHLKVLLPTCKSID